MQVLNVCNMILLFVILVTHTIPLLCFFCFCHLVSLRFAELATKIGIHMFKVINLLRLFLIFITLSIFINKCSIFKCSSFPVMLNQSP